MSDQASSQVEPVVSDFDRECVELATRLTRWRNRALRGLRSQIDGLYDQGPVEDQAEFEQGRERGLNEVVALINDILGNR